MKSYPVGASVAVDVPLQDLNGDPVTPTGLTWVVQDGTGTPIAGPFTIDPNAATDPITVTVPGTVNTTAGAYAVVLTIQTDTALIDQQVDYAVRNASRLVFLTNSFQTYAQAQFVGDDIPGLSNWVAATDEQRQPALIEAFERLKRQSYVIPYPDLVDAQDYYIPGWVMRLEPRQWALMTSQLFLTYPQVFRDKLNRAQVIEANYLLGNPAAASYAAMGIFSKKTGEDSVMFKSGIRPLRLGLARETFDALTGFIDNRFVLTRS